MITLKSSELIQYNPIRLGYADKEKVREILDDLLKKSVIRESTLEYSSLIVFTRKKNGEVKMYIDFRALNKIIAITILCCLSRINWTRYATNVFLVLWRKNGFYHIAMSPDFVKFTSFVIPWDNSSLSKCPLI